MINAPLAHTPFLFTKQAEVVDTGKAFEIIGDSTKSFNKTLPKLVLPAVKDMKKPVSERRAFQSARPSPCAFFPTNFPLSTLHS